MRPIPPWMSTPLFQLTACQIEGVAQGDVHVVRTCVAGVTAVSSAAAVHVNHDAVNHVSLTATSRCFDHDMTSLDLRSDIPELSGATPDGIDDGLRLRKTTERDLWQHVRFLPCTCSLSSRRSLRPSSIT